jgi:uncharacterized protein (TIGR03435 family)
MKHLVGVAAISVAGLWAQAPAAKTGFEVASVKECKGMDPSPPSSSSPGRLSLGCWQLKLLIQQAYDVFESGKVNPLNPAMALTPMEGDPAWIRSARYSIDAKADSPQTAATMRGPMMQALLEERFHLKIHRETREVPVYIMTVAKGGPKMQPAKEGSCQPLDFSEGPNMKPGNEQWCAAPKMSKKGATTVFDIHGATFDLFAKMLHPDGRAVIDRTGLTGKYDIHLELDASTANSSAPGGGAASDPSPHAPDIAATRDQLGLRLDPGKGPIEYLVIDHIERLSDN